MKIGPAAILSVLQILGIGAGGIWFLSAMTTKFDAAQSRIEAVHMDVKSVNREVKDVSAAQSNNASRIVGVETAVVYLKDALTRIDGKLK